MMNGDCMPKKKLRFDSVPVVVGELLYSVRTTTMSMDHQFKYCVVCSHTIQYDNPTLLPLNNTRAFLK